MNGVEKVLHISDIKKYERCPKLFHLSKEKRKHNTFFSFFHPFDNLDELIRRKIGVVNAFCGERNDISLRAQSASEKFLWLVNARFEYNSLRIRIPYMHNNMAGWELYFVVLQSAPTSEKAREFAFNVKVLKKLGFRISNVYIIHLNKDYKRAEELSTSELFTVVDYFYNQKGNHSTSIMDAISSISIDLDSVIAEITTGDYVVNSDIKKTKCTRGSKCEYFDYCFPEYMYAPDESILHLSSSQNKYDMFGAGIMSLHEADLSKVEGTRLQYAQIMAARASDGFFMDELAVISWFKEISAEAKTVSFLDFEWDTYCIPPYRKMSPLQVLPFQYSLHVSKGEEVTHHEYLGFGDCREEFIRRLISDLPTEGPIFAYNAMGAEALRLKELADSYPLYAEKILHIVDRLKDLSLPFEMGLIYDLRMRGLFSLKALCSMIHPDSDYSSLEVVNGLEAVKLHRKLESEAAIEEASLLPLLDYCSKDTEELFAVYLWIKEKIGIVREKYI